MQRKIKALNKAFGMLKDLTPEQVEKFSEATKRKIDELDIEEDVIMKMPPKSRKKAIMIVGTEKEEPCCGNCEYWRRYKHKKFLSFGDCDKTLRCKWYQEDDIKLKEITKNKIIEVYDADSRILFPKNHCCIHHKLRGEK